MPMDQIKRFYDLYVDELAKEGYSTEVTLLSIKEFIEIINKENPRILDLGCGAGYESMRLKQLGAEVVGVDYSSESIKIAREKNPTILFYLMDYFEINAELGYFDGILAASSLIHLKTDEYDRLLEIINIILKPKGWFLNIYIKGHGQAVHNPEIKGEKLIRTIELYEDEEMKQLFQKHGYKFIKHGFLDESLKDRWASAIFQKI
jgi:2-polyprenyl-3-methyl-5-hydroxy-6-metoxy-1,4-benzoquinol methylase